MRDHHQRTVDKLVEYYGEKPEFLALIIAGSLAQGTESEYADVDVVLVATREEFTGRKRNHEAAWCTSEPCDYPGGYVDVKVVDLDTLRAAAERGSEPTRSWLKGALVAYSRLSGLEELLQRIATYPEDGRAEKMKSFYAQVQAFRWFMEEAEKKADRFLAVTSAAKLVFYGARLILAYNRILYPYYKRLMPYLESAPEKPADMLELAEALLAEPSKDNADRFCESLLGFCQWEVPEGGWVSRWCEDIEWKWLEGRASLEDS